MKKMKVVALILVAMGVFTQCKSIKFDKNPPFKINGATFNNWVGGQPGVSGTRVMIGYTSEEKVAFESVYFNNRETKAALTTENGITYVIGHFSTSTVNNKEDLVLHADGKKEINNTLPKEKKFPFKLKENEVVISFKEGKKIKYIKIEKIKKVASTFYPQVKQEH